jgi:spore germination protein KA
MCSLRSFGVPYLSPVAPLSFSGLKDFVIRVPWWLMKGRPKTINWRKSQRVMDNGKPGPSKNKLGDN